MRVPVVMIIISYLILILTDIYIWWDINYWTKRKRGEPKGRCCLCNSGRWIYVCFALAVLILLTVGLCLPRRNASEGITVVMWILYTTLTITLAQLIYILCSLIGFLPLLLHKKRFNAGKWIGLPVALIVFCCMWWGSLVGKNQIQVVYVEITSDRLPESFNDYKIAQLSDLHVGTWGTDTTFVSRLVDSVNNLKPDLIVFTGDIVNRHSLELQPFMKTLSRLHARDGVLSVLGNHDYGDYVSWKSDREKLENLDTLKKMQTSMGWILLDNANTSIKNEKGDSIILIGVGNWGEPPFSKYGDLKIAYPESRFKDDNFKILLSHNPEHWNREVSHVSNIDLTLAGHTHAMQFMIKLGDWKWSPSKYKYDQWAGLYERNDKNALTRVYVNIGVGEVAFPMRLGATPEITLFTLRR